MHPPFFIARVAALPRQSKREDGNMPKILVIDDNHSVCEALDLLFSLHDIETTGAETPEAGLAVLDDGDFDLVIQDMNFSADTTSGEEGAALFTEIRRRHPGLPVVLLTAWTNLSAAVELVKNGASDYLAKPWDDEKLVATVRNLLELGRLAKENRTLHSERRSRHARLANEYALGGLVYESEAMHELVGVAVRVA